MNNNEIFQELKNSILNFDPDKVKETVYKALEEGIKPSEIITKGLSPGVRTIGEKYEAGEYFLPQLVKAGDLMKMGVELVNEKMTAEEIASSVKGKIVLGTVKEDVHDIGKNIVGSMLEAAGFEVVDLGTEVPPQDFVNVAKRENADIIAASSLMSFTKNHQRDIVEYLESLEERDNYKVIVGGGAVDQTWADKIGADGYAEDAQKTVKLVEKLLKE